MFSSNAAFYVNGVLAVGHLVAAGIVAGILIDEDGAWSVPLVFEFNVWNETIPDSGQFVVFKESVSVTEKFYPGWALIFCSIISGFHHLLATLTIKTYWSNVLLGFNGYRWIDYAFSASIMVMTNEVLWLAPAELSMLMAVFITEMFIVLSGGLSVESLWASKVTIHGEAKSKWISILFSTSFVVFCLFWARYFFILRYGDENSGMMGYGDSESGSTVPDFVYIILWVLIIGFSLFPICFFLKIVRIDLWKAPHFSLSENTTARNAFFEFMFSLLSALAKIPLLVFFASGLLARTSRVAFDSSDTLPSDDQSLDALGLAGGVAAVIIVVVGSILILDWKQKLPIILSSAELFI